MPRACKARTLPIELIPHEALRKRRPWQDSNLQPLDPKSSALSIAPQGPVPLVKTGSSGIRTHASRWRLELESSALDHSAMKPPRGCKMATPVGFEPTRAEPTHLAGERLNHSAKASRDVQKVAGARPRGAMHDTIKIGKSSGQKQLRHPGIEPGPPRWQRGIITTRLMTPIL